MVPSTDPFLAVSFAAACSKRLKLGVNLVPFGYEPYVFARQVAELDRLTGGRLLVTLVPGLDQSGERAALGIGGADRGRLLDERIPMLRTWWAGDAVALAEHDEPVHLALRPSQDPLEVWLGGAGPKAIRRAGRLADGWLGSLVTPARAGEIRTQIEREAATAGRRIDPEHFGLSIPYVREAADLSAVRAVRRPGNAEYESLVPVGADGLRSLVAQLVEQGLSKFVVRPVGNVRSWSTELDWIASALLDLET
jgi:alkanesulfonate monooxygenase SsuD/methylene tetrahydromethanopterin reductase-like flavin-dependent oxidoreductase (luciferase family)